MYSRFYCVIGQWDLFHCFRCFSPSINLTLSNMQGFRRVSPIVCAFLAFATCKAMANDACIAVLLVFQKIPVLSSFCFFRWDSLKSKKDLSLLIILGWEFARCFFWRSRFHGTVWKCFHTQNTLRNLNTILNNVCKSKIQVIVLIVTLLLWHSNLINTTLCYFCD